MASTTKSKEREVVKWDSRWGRWENLLELPHLGSVWYMCLKTENCYLKTFMEIPVGEKVC